MTPELSPYPFIAPVAFSASISAPEKPQSVSASVSWAPMAGGGPWMAPGVAEKVTAGDTVTVFVTYPKDFPPSGQKTRVLLPEATVISVGDVGLTTTVSVGSPQMPVTGLLFASPLKLATTLYRSMFQKARPVLAP